MRNFGIILLAFCLTGTAQVQSFDSKNVTDLLAIMPFEADYPIARDIRYTYGSILELKKKDFDPFIVTNEDPDYYDVTDEGISGQVLDAQYEAFKAQGRDWLNKNEASWSVTQLEDYQQFQTSMENSMLAVHTYYNIMGALSKLSFAWTKKEAQSLTDWMVTYNKCVGEDAPERSVLHVNMMRLTKGERFKFHSTNDLMAILTLETSDTTIISTQAMQLWVNTKREQPAPEDALPQFGLTASQEIISLLKPVVPNGYTHRFVLLLNAGIKDIYSKLELQ